jgi:hypothetical protein
MGARMSSADRTRLYARIEAMKCCTEAGVINSRRRMMKNLVVVAIVVGCIGMSVAAAAPGLIGLGVMGGEPSGFSAKLWLGSHVALDGGIGYAYLWNKAGVHLHGDLLLHTGSLLPSLVGFLPLYAGAGVRVRLANGVENPREVGLRVPFGAEYVLPIVPLGIFFELAPILDFAPGIAFNGNAALGVRYYFGPRS